MLDFAAAAGAAGAFPVDPWSAGFAALGGAIGGAPSSAASGPQNFAPTFDASGWTVTTGGGYTNGATITKPNQAQPLAAGGALDLQSLAVMGLIGILFWRLA